MEPQQLTINGTQRTLEKKFDHTCIHCHKPFKSAYKKSSYCSAACKSKQGRINKANSLNMTPTTEEIKVTENAKVTPLQKVRPPKLPKAASDSTVVVGTPIFDGLTPQMQIAVDLLKQDARRWEQLYREEKDKRKKIADKYETLRDEVAELKVDHRIEAIENKKPGGLEGLAENPMILKLMDHVGPALGALMVKLVDNSPSSQLVGVDGQLDEITQTQANEMVKWFISLPEDSRKVVYEILTEWAGAKSIEVLNDTLLRMRNVLKAGTVITPYAGFGTI